jgi:hypothetical protein
MPHQSAELATTTKMRVRMPPTYPRPQPRPETLPTVFGVATETIIAL